MADTIASTLPVAQAVGYIRSEVTYEMDKWVLVQDCILGEKAVKSKTTTYLPQPNPEDNSNENKLRYSSYLQRAVFYNVTRRTLDGLVGQVFMRDPLIELPEALKALITDVDGTGVGIDQQAKKALSLTMAYARGGLLIDYPPVEGVTTVQDQDKGYVRPTITLYEPWNIINWRYITRGARRLYSLIVLNESYIETDNGFQELTKSQWRVLRLTPAGYYQVEIWRDDGLDVPSSVYVPKDARGNPLTEIPFIFLGAVNNDCDIDPSPLYDLAALNIAHYRNSADYEEACYIVGQPTPYFAGLTKQWVDEVLKGKVMLGSRAAVPLPEGGGAGLLQVNPNTLPFEAMQSKERQMVALGAKLVEQRDVQRTLGEAQMEASAETSILATAAKNVATAYKAALRWCAGFTGASDAAIDYELNTDFPAARMTPEERAQLVAEWQAGGISYTEYRRQLRKAGVATEDDDEVKTANQNDTMRTEGLKIGVNTGNSLSGGTENNRTAGPKQNGKTQ